MADQRVTELVAVVTPALTDVTATRQSGDNRDKKVTLAQRLSLIKVVDDTAPQLGGDLDTNGRNIVNADATLRDLGVTAGTGAGANPGGEAKIVGGVATGTGDGGVATVRGGSPTGGGDGGLAQLEGGAGDGTNGGGQAKVTGGISGSGATGSGGGVEITGGASVATDGDGGNVIIGSGAGAGSGADGDIFLDIGGVNEFFVSDAPNADLQSADVTGPALRNRPTSGIVPTVVPNRGDLGTGVGSGQVGSFSAIAGDVEALRLAQANGGILQLPQADIAITAFAGGGQGNLSLKSSYNILSVVATAGDAVTLPAIHRVNTLIFIKNDGVAAADIFPDLGDDLGLGTNIAFSLPAGESISFIGTVLNTTWTRWFGDTAHAIPNNVVQARRTTDFTLTTAFVDVTLDTTDVETDSADIEHDVVTDRIVVKVAGTYKISYEVDAGATTIGDDNVQLEGRVRLNDAGTGIPGSNANCGVWVDGSIDGDIFDNHLSQTFYATLAANDFVTLQLEKIEIAGSTETYVADRILFTVERCL